MEFLFDFGLFLAKAVIIVVAIVALFGMLMALSSKKKSKKGDLEIIDLSKQLEDTKKCLEDELLSDAELKSRHKAQKKEAKLKKSAMKKRAKKGDFDAPAAQLYVIDFKGSIDAKEVFSLREEISAILSVANEKDEVFVRLESGGGMVHGYGLAASQLQRLKDNKIPLTISVDKVAASGGYMMACIADKIIAAPFAILGSIGVIAQIPNFNKVLKKHNIEFEQLTAGQYKRTLTMFGENDDLGRDKFKQELQETHDLFKQFVSQHRPNLDIEKIATGEHWYGLQAIERDLIDKIQTSDDYLMSQLHKRHVVQIKYSKHKKMTEKFTHATSLALENSLLKLMQLSIKNFIK